ncbi:c-type cytochrome [Loktanella sp. IMCC34160]|uniref:c-type cytochrome n=1 Tax=Loktanella sp. IMCC34160 TaxID=2510646 RepID=UPI00101C6D92|nr:c-type cytochrome [Loktanella sp. IMCC34160]RYG89795.1 c-type cytochrome [Loktanella sp. IMCC34160]
MKKNIIFIGAAGLAAVAALSVVMGQGRVAEAQTDPAAAAPLVEVTVPEMLGGNAEFGKLAFDTYCVDCHGQNAAGRDGYGPPLIHKIYEPSHHGDMAFLLAARNGVRAHHWRFGDMPPVEGITEGEVAAIVAYIRRLQQVNGIN